MTKRTEAGQEQVMRELLKRNTQITIDACIMVLRASIQNLEQLKTGIDTMEDKP